MSAVGQRVVGPLDANLVHCRDWEIDRHMETVRIIVAVGDALDLAVTMAVDAHEPAGKTLGGRRNQAPIQLGALRFVIHTLPHVTDNAKAKLLRFLRLAMMLTAKRLGRIITAHCEDSSLLRS